MNLDQFCLSYEDLPTEKGQAHVCKHFSFSFYLPHGLEEVERKKNKKKQEGSVPPLEMAHPYCLWATQAPTSPFSQGKLLILLFQCKAKVQGAEEPLGT